MDEVVTFDPTWPLDWHQALNDAAGVIAVPLVWTPRLVYTRTGEPRRREPDDVGIWHCPLTNHVLAEWVTAAREVVLLPLDGEYKAVADETLAQLEAALHARKRRRPPRDVDLAQWTPQAFRDAVEAVCGPGKRKGAEHWFRCPLHDDGDPSLEVNFERRIWKCWAGCGEGGHKDWLLRTSRLRMTA